ncbi:sulfotransferase [Mangrovimicrobium sediminis]|uniref:Sulfotransferase n=1 Tax=Mangrovimicrobium sediminis TaxID=2562682 RepID=A0A4Z0M5W1_9GAMM|nr:sulfotransferase [Haliea sp. SAOS-164]TGD74889.1 sulfotransferase [Haliea sp. SAOS-164]
MQANPSLAPLRAIVCGYEKSGTTLINEILRRHPRLDSGHEVGVLLADSPRQFHGKQPYYAFFKQTWKVTDEQMQEICDTDAWGEFYARARMISPLITDKTVELFDKTPVYMLHLREVLAKVPGIPCVVNVRDPRALMLSWANWSGHRDAPGEWIEANFEYCENRFLSYARGYRDALADHSDRILLNRFEPLCLEPQIQLENIFNFFGLEFSSDYLTFESEHFVYGTTVSQDYLAPYRQALTPALCQRILQATREFGEWHYHG